MIDHVTPSFLYICPIPEIFYIFFKGRACILSLSINDIHHTASCDDSISQRSHFMSLLCCVYAKSYSHRRIGHLSYLLDDILQICFDIPPHACDAHGRNHIDKAGRIFQMLLIRTPEVGATI